MTWQEGRCAAGYVMGHGKRCRVCGASPSESCGRIGEAIKKEASQRDALLAACKSAANVLVACVQPLGGCDDERDMKNALAELEAAIAAAEGEQS